MPWPQLVTFAWLALLFIVKLFRLGDTIEITLMNTIADFLILVGLLWWGGFWEPLLGQDEKKAMPVPNQLHEEELEKHRERTIQIVDADGKE